MLFLWILLTNGSDSEGLNEGNSRFNDYVLALLSSKVLN
jgi:hypothetical protein